MKTCLLRAAGHNASELDHVVVVGARVRLRLLAVRPPRRLLGVEQDVNVLEWRKWKEICGLPAVGPLVCQ